MGIFGTIKKKVSDVGKEIGRDVGKIFGPGEKTTYTRKPLPRIQPMPVSAPTGKAGDSGTFGPAQKNVPNSLYKKKTTSDGYMKMR